MIDGPYGQRLRSGHLYQLITYLQHERVRQPGKGLAGMLLYASVNKSMRLKYELLGIPVLVATVDLTQNWPDIEAELHEFLDNCATATSAPKVVANVYDRQWTCKYPPSTNGSESKTTSNSGTIELPYIGPR
jgi:hypothetical protein